MSLRLLVPTLAASAALSLAGCSSSAPDGAAAAEAENSVAMALSYRFEPAEITVLQGATVTWTNSDNFTHNVRLGDEVIGEAEPGQTVTHTFEDVGTYAYDCSLHPQDMEGVVTVQ